jgi:peptidoglycan/LPS O-acetylase OafA/YrhL
MKHQSAFSDRIPSLDGLRAISIGLVIFAHLCGTTGFPLGREIFNAGGFGVRVFFVISGFLITGILLKELDKTATINLKKFYYRRTLRIFPPYYFFLAIVGLVSLTGILQLPLGEWLSSVFYINNFTTASTWELGHTWSLAVEEQFYLLMPALFLFGKRRAFFVLCLIVILCPFIRLVSFSLFPDSDLRWVTFGFQANADSLAVGCILAFGRTMFWQNRIYQKVMNSRLFFAVPVLAIALNLFDDHPKITFLVFITMMNFCIALCIDWAVTFHTGIVGKILNSRLLVYIGGLSYSIYLWQQLFLNRHFESIVTSFPVNLLLTIFCAIVSYYFIEKPSLNLRQKYENRLFRSS